jgi:hypothetical protein
VLSAGFDLAFFISFLLGIVILVLALATKEVVHPDNLDSSVEPGSGML